MSTQSITPAFKTFQDADGQPLENGNIYIGTAGLAAQTNQIQVYWDAALTVTAAQPIKTTGGFPVNAGAISTIYVDASDYSIEVANRNNTSVYSSLNQQDRFSVGVITYKSTRTGSVNRLVSDKLGDVVNVEDFGAVGDGVTDDAAAIQAAIDSFVNGGRGTLSFRGEKTYAIGSMLNNNNRDLIWDGNGCSIELTSNADYVLTLAGSGTTIQDLRFEKSSGVVADGIKISGIRHRFERVSASVSAWPRFFHLVGCNESHFTNIRIDNDTATLTGNIFELDYSVNNTITESFIGHCQDGVFCSTVTHPTEGYSNEGLVISDNVFVFCDKAVNGDAITSLHVDSNVIDFCITRGIFCTNGKTLFVTSNWIANDTTSVSFIGVGIAAAFSSAYVAGNYMVGNVTGTAFSCGGAFGKFVNNHVQDLDFGAINSGGGDESYSMGNTMEGGGTTPTGDAGRYDMIGNRLILGSLTDDTEHAFQGGLGWAAGSNSLPGQHERNGLPEFVNKNDNGTGLVPSSYGDVPTTGKITIQENGTDNFLIAEYFKQNTADTPNVTTIASSGLTFSAANAGGTIVVTGASVPANLRYSATIMKMHA